MKRVYQIRRHLSQYTNAVPQSALISNNSNKTSLNESIYLDIKIKIDKLLKNPQLRDSLYRFCVTANTCSISPHLRIYLSNLVPRNVDLKFSNSNSILQHQKFSVIFVVKSLSRLPSMVYNDNRYKHDANNDKDISLEKLVSLEDIFQLSIQSLAARYKGRIGEHAREVSEIFESLIDTCKFVSRHNLSYKYTYLNDKISQFATSISEDIVSTFRSSKNHHLYPLTFSIGKFLEIHGIQNKELYNIIYDSICNPRKWIIMDYTKSNYQKFLLDSLTRLLQFKLPQENIDNVIHYLLVSDILPINSWSLLFLHLTRFSFKKTTLDLALMTFLRKYKYCKFPSENNNKIAHGTIENNGVPSSTSLVKHIDLISKNIYFNINATRTCHERTYTNMIDLESDYTYNIICGITNIKKRLKLDEFTSRYIDEILELLWPRVNQLLPTYPLLNLKPVAISYIELISSHITCFSNIGYSTKQRNIVNSIATELLKFTFTFTLSDYIESVEIISKLYCNILYNGDLVTSKFVVNKLITNSITRGVFGENITGLTQQEQIFTLDFPKCVKFSQQLFKHKHLKSLDQIDDGKINELTILLQERIISCISSMNQDHLNANSFYIVLLNMISLNFKGITQLLDTLDVHRCIKLISIDDKVEILRMVIGQSVNEDFIPIFIDELKQNVSISQNKLPISKLLIIINKLIETVDRNYMDTFLSYATPSICDGDFIDELLEISTKIDFTNYICKQFIIATLNSCESRQLNISQLTNYLKCSRLVGQKLSASINKCLDAPLHNANIQQIELILNEIASCRICDDKVIKRLVDWSIHLYFNEQINVNNLSTQMVLSCFGKILSHLLSFDIINNKIIDLSLSFVDKYSNEFQPEIISIINLLLKFDQYPQNFKEIFTWLLIYSKERSDLSSDAQKQLYEIYLQSLQIDNSIYDYLQQQQLIDLLNGIPSYQWFKEQEMEANEFKNTDKYIPLLDLFTELTGISPSSCVINPYFVNYLYEDTGHSRFNNLAILLLKECDMIQNSNKLFGPTLHKVKYLRKLGYKVVTIDFSKLNNLTLFKDELGKLL